MKNVEKPASPWKTLENLSNKNKLSLTLNKVGKQKHSETKKRSEE